jgi:hypothetical protein
MKTPDEPTPNKRMQPTRYTARLIRQPLGVMNKMDDKPSL